MPKYISDLPTGVLDVSTQMEMQNGADGQKFTGQDLLDFVGANVSAIKSIQRGTVAISTSTTTISVSISSINPAKSSVTLYGSLRDSANLTNLPRVTGLGASVLQLAFLAPNSNQTLSWEVVEFN